MLCTAWETAPPQRCIDQEQSERQHQEPSLSPRNGLCEKGRQRKEADLPLRLPTWGLLEVEMAAEGNTGTAGDDGSPGTTDSQLQDTQRSKGTRRGAQSTSYYKWREMWGAMTGAGGTAKTKPHSHKLQQRDHTMTTARTRAARIKAKQSKDANMIDANEVHTPQRTKRNQ